MTRRSKLARGDGLPERYVLLDHHLLDSDAFHALSAPAVKVLLAIWRRHNGANNGEISFAVREGEPYGLSRRVTAAALAELQDKGFLVCTRAGHFSVKRLARTWRLTMHKHYGNPPTREFARWAPAQKQKPVTPAGQIGTSAGLSSGREHPDAPYSHANGTVSALGGAPIGTRRGHL